MNDEIMIGSVLASSITASQSVLPGVLGRNNDSVGCAISPTFAVARVLSQAVSVHPIQTELKDVGASGLGNPNGVER